jgi:hypothetical protein
MWALGTLVLATVAGCVAGPDAQSGDDRFRHQAVQIPLNQPVPDTLSWPGRDRTDWKWFIVPAEGLLTVNVHFVNVDSAAYVELFDTYGKPVARRIKEHNRDDHLQFTQPVAAGRYFLRLMAYDEGDESESTVLLSMEE